jgi:hypothetical protein
MIREKRIERLISLFHHLSVQVLLIDSREAANFSRSRRIRSYEFHYSENG